MTIQIKYYPKYPFCEDNKNTCSVCGAKPGEGCKYVEETDKEKSEKYLLRLRSREQETP